MSRVNLTIHYAQGSYVLAAVGTNGFETESLSTKEYPVFSSKLSEILLRRDDDLSLEFYLTVTPDAKREMNGEVSKIEALVDVYNKVDDSSQRMSVLFDAIKKHTARKK